MPLRLVDAIDCAVIPEQLDRLRPELTASPDVIWIPDVECLNDALVDRILERCNLAVLPDIARLCFGQQSQTTPEFKAVPTGAVNGR